MVGRVIMLVLDRWLDERGGALLRSPTGAEVFRTFDQLSEDFYSFEHRSPNGLTEDIVVYIHRSMIDAKPALRVVS